VQGRALEMWNNNGNRGRAAARNNQPYNNALHQTGRGGAVASRPVVEARPAGERECWTDHG
jgi:hypothetical protein